VCLTPNGDYCWYRQLAPRLGLDTHHLSTDRFLGAAELGELLRDAGLTLHRLEHWRFIPRGDLPDGWGLVLLALDWVGEHLGQRGQGCLRGGLAILATKGPVGPSSPT
jgi:2-polyprenyl-6-hydroxyphenyl methylase/3-demethylubiquinone-9 3-methyltransferase